MLHYFSADCITFVFSGYLRLLWKSGKLEIGRKYQYYNILMTACSREHVQRSLSSQKLKMDWKVPFLHQQWHLAAGWRYKRSLVFPHFIFIICTINLLTDYILNSFLVSGLVTQPGSSYKQQEKGFSIWPLSSSEKLQNNQLIKPVIFIPVTPSIPARLTFMAVVIKFWTSFSNFPMSLKMTPHPLFSLFGLCPPTVERGCSALRLRPRLRLSAGGQTCYFPNQKSICNLSHFLPHRLKVFQFSKSKSCWVFASSTAFFKPVRHCLSHHTSHSTSHSLVKLPYQSFNYSLTGWVTTQVKQSLTGCVMCFLMSISYISSAVLQAQDVGVLRQPHHSVQRQLQTRVSRYAIQDHRHRAVVRHLCMRHRGVRLVHLHISTDAPC